MLLHRVVESLNKHKVRYTLVGGYAVALHGAIRGTVDIDFVIQLDKKSFVAAEAALLDVGLKPRLPIVANELFEFREEYIKNRNLIAWSFINPTNLAEVVDILINKDARKLSSVTKEVHGLKIKVVSIGDLIAMKKESARPQDLEDVKALEKLI
jgi:predicted nucleotidyltransferase